MSVLIDTTIWSLGLRRIRRDLNPEERALRFEWEDILKRGDACISGPIIQELLSGVSNPKHLHELIFQLELVEELPLFRSTWLLAAEFYNICRKSGIAPGSMDMTICAVASEGGVPIFTTDPDFLRYASILPIALHVAA